MRIGFLVNPVAGMGGRVGLKGTDGVSEEAVRRGAEPVAPVRARETLAALAGRPQSKSLTWVTASGPMGAGLLQDAGIAHDVVFESSDPTTANDTRKACEAFLENGVDLIVFAGGDGTARDVASVVESKVPIVGVPAGVKMHSAVFGLNPASVAAILADFADGQTATVDAEVLDVDEERYRAGEWVVRLYATVKTLHEPSYIQTGKMTFEAVPQEAVLDGIAEFLIEEMEEAPGTLYLLGPGGTLHHVKEALGIEGTLLGIDAVMGKALLAADVNEEDLLRLLDAHPTAKLVLSPIGAQGFVLGRGNAQVSPEVLRRIGWANVVVAATPDKLRHTPALCVDTGDAELDRAFAAKEYLYVVQGYREMKVHPVGP